MDDQGLVTEIERMITPILEEEEVDLVSLRVLRKGKSLVIDILADRSLGGITLDQCSVINRKIVDKIETETAVPQDYCLMVSSPGIDWPLKTKKDFLRVLNREVRIFLLEVIDGHLESVGIIQSVSDDHVAILRDGREIVIPLAKIRKAIQIV